MVERKYRRGAFTVLVMMLIRVIRVLPAKQKSKYQFVQFA